MIITVLSSDLNFFIKDFAKEVPLKSKIKSLVKGSNIDEVQAPTSGPSKP